MSEPWDWAEPAHFSVLGTPMPQGSKACICINGHGRIIEGRRQGDRKAFAQWRRDVTAGALNWQTTHNAEPLDAPCRLRLTFRLARPKSVTRLWPTVPPDIDKLARAVCDSLTKVAYVDDSRVCELVVRKQYALSVYDALPPGVAITLERLEA